jgi:predicted ATPase
MGFMIHLKKINLADTGKGPEVFPFTLPLIRAQRELVFRSPVTFFVGENGTGKSTVLEALAAGINAITVGGEDVARDPTLHHARALADYLRFVWQKKMNRGFFLRAEDFFRFTRRLQDMKEELDRIKAGYDGQPNSYGLRLARGALEGQKAQLTKRYGEDLDAHSHGESFFKLFKSRLVPGGLYLLDEPETPFSPKRQMALIVLIHDMVSQDCQFIIATHSPILMTYPGASILNFDELPVKEADYNDLEHVQLVRSFLNNPQKVLDVLLKPE